MLKGLRYSTLVIFIISVLIYIGQIIKLTSLGLPAIVQQAISLFGKYFPQYQTYVTSFIETSENLKIYFVAALISVIVIYFVMISILTMTSYVILSKQEKNGITLGKMLSVIVFDFIGMYLLLFSNATNLLNNVSMIANSSIILGVLFIVHMFLAISILIIYCKDNYKKNNFKEQINVVYKFCLYSIIVVLVIFFVNKVIMVLIINAFVDTGLKAIDVSSFVTSTLLASIDFSKPVSDFLPPAFVTIATNFNIPISSSLSDFGVSQTTIESIINIGLYQPINDSIFKFLNGITNSFIFKGFGLKLFGLAAAIGLLVVNLVQIKLPLVKYTVLVVIDAVIFGLIIIYFTSSVLVILALLVLIYDLYRLFIVYKDQHLKSL